MKELADKIQQLMKALRDLRKDDFTHYHIHQDGFRITDKPMHINDIIKQHGPVQKLESQGFRLVPASKDKLSED